MKYWPQQVLCSQQKTFFARLGKALVVVTLVVMGFLQVVVPTHAAFAAVPVKSAGVSASAAVHLTMTRFHAARTPIPLALQGQTQALTHLAPFASCSRGGCDGYDAYATGCAGGNASWRVVDSVPVANWSRTRIGWLQLWWSDTCGTNWARFVCTVTASACPFISDLELMEENPPGSQSGYGVQYVRDVSSIDVRTKQQYLPTIRAQAHLMIDCTNQGCAGASTHWE